METPKPGTAEQASFKKETAALTIEVEALAEAAEHFKGTGDKTADLSRLQQIITDHHNKTRLLKFFQNPGLGSRPKIHTWEEIEGFKEKAAAPVQPEPVQTPVVAEKEEPEEEPVVEPIVMTPKKITSPTPQPKPDDILKGPIDVPEKKEAAGIEKIEMNNQRIKELLLGMLMPLIKDQPVKVKDLIVTGNGTELQLHVELEGIGFKGNFVGKPILDVVVENNGDSIQIDPKKVTINANDRVRGQLSPSSLVTMGPRMLDFLAKKYKGKGEVSKVQISGGQLVIDIKK
jgi:hypothetical protein